jgi:hypothetical protein
MRGPSAPAFTGENTMIKFRWEKTNYGYNVWAKKPDSRAYVYFGHFRTKKSALEQYDAEQCNYA